MSLTALAAQVHHAGIERRTNIELSTQQAIAILNEVAALRSAVEEAVTCAKVAEAKLSPMMKIPVTHGRDKVFHIPKGRR